MATILSPELEQFIQTEVASGKYANPDEAVTAAVGLLRQRERKLDELRREIQIGHDALERGEYIDITDEASERKFFDELMAEVPFAPNPDS